MRATPHSNVGGHAIAGDVHRRSRPTTRARYLSQFSRMPSYFLRPELSQYKRRLIGAGVAAAPENAGPDTNRIEHDQRYHAQEQPANGGVEPGVEDQRLSLGRLGGRDLAR